MSHTATTTLEYESSPAAVRQTRYVLHAMDTRMSQVRVPIHAETARHAYGIAAANELIVSDIMLPDEEDADQRAIPDFGELKWTAVSPRSIPRTVRLSAGVRAAMGMKPWTAFDEACMSASIWAAAFGTLTLVLGTLSLVILMMIRSFGRAPAMTVAELVDFGPIAVGVAIITLAHFVQKASRGALIATLVLVCIQTLVPLLSLLSVTADAISVTINLVWLVMGTLTILKLAISLSR